MKCYKRVFGVLVLCAAATASGFADEPARKDYFDADVAVKARLPSFSLVTYTGSGGGASFNAGEILPLVEASGGFQFAPWIAVGGFWAADPLSDFEHANLGLDFADTEAAYAYMSGTEILVTPWADRMFHPLFRATVGGISVGYLKDAEDGEGYDSSVENRYFFGSVSTGAEMNLSRHLRIGLRGGWRFAGNDDTLGIDEGDLSGFEASLSVRALWRTVVD